MLLGATGAETDATVPIGLLGAGVGVGGAYLFGRDRDLRERDVAATASGATWGGLVGLSIVKMADNPYECDDFTCVEGPEDVRASDYHVGGLVGSTVGLGTGWLVSKYLRPSIGDISLTNSLVTYGVSTGLLLAVAMDPAQDRAYALNGLLGGGVGLTAALLLTPRLEMSRKRMVLIDLGAGAGAATGYLVIGGIADKDDEELRAGLGAAGLLLGGGLVWWLTRNDGRPARAASETDADPSVAPALVMRDRDGTWHMGPPAVTAIQSPAGRSTMGVSILSGSW
jgi:hypothetical protein